MNDGWIMVGYCHEPNEQQWPVTGTVHHVNGCQGNVGGGKRRRWWTQQGTAEELAKSLHKCGTCQRMRSVREAEGR